MRAMKVEITREPKLSKLDHLFVLLAEKPKDADLIAPLRDLVHDTVKGARFEGRADESITVLAEEPRKVTLIGLGKQDALSIRGLRAAFHSIGKIAQKQRDDRIGVVYPPRPEPAPRGLVSGARDYKYSAF